MTGSSRDRARTLELLIRAAVAEERLLGARLARMAESQRMTRAAVESELRRERFGQPAPENGASPPSPG